MEIKYIKEILNKNVVVFESGEKENISKEENLFLKDKKKCVFSKKIIKNKRDIFDNRRFFSLEEIQKEFILFLDALPNNYNLDNELGLK